MAEWAAGSRSYLNESHLMTNSPSVVGEYTGEILQVLYEELGANDLVKGSGLISWSYTGVYSWRIQLCVSHYCLAFKRLLVFLYFSPGQVRDISEECLWLGWTVKNDSLLEALTCGVSGESCGNRIVEGLGSQTCSTVFVLPPLAFECQHVSYFPSVTSYYALILHDFLFCCPF